MAGPKTIVLCADGTCNVFGQRSSNVARLLEFIDLHDATSLVACYDQGVGTQFDQGAAIEAFRDGPPRKDALQLLERPRDGWRRPWTIPHLIASMLFGWGLRDDVRQLYCALGDSYVAGDSVFLFGFSRGAFAVRALAGFVWRAGVPAESSKGRAAALFDRDWPAFVRRELSVHSSRARAGQSIPTADCPIHFLGCWDTVKSYGSLRPVMLPHLRHNPSVEVVRHALALDEQRGWFEPTSWGWLDSDKKQDATPPAAIARIDRAEQELLDKRNVSEVWFTGCHSDIGGGNCGATSDVALRWMLGEACAHGLVLNTAGLHFVSAPPDTELPVIRESRSLIYRIIEACVPRRQINNASAWPHLRWAPRGASKRDPLAHPRKGVVRVHESVRLPPKPGAAAHAVTVEVARTLRGADHPWPQRRGA